MKLDNLFEQASKEIKISKKIKDMIKKTLAILNQKINEENELTDSNKSLSTQDKRKLLKKVYAKTLTKMGQENNIPIFNQLIDQVPESYLDYELKIDMNNAGSFVEDLLKGKGQITTDELENISDVISGVGIPAIKEFAFGGKEMSKEDADFGSDGINKKTKEYLDSKKKRNNPTLQLSAPESEELISSVRALAQKENTTAMDIIKKMGKDLIIKDPKIKGILSKLDPGKKTDLLKRLPKIIIMNKTYEEAKKEDPIFLNFTENEYYDLFKSFKNETKERVSVN